MIDTKTPQRRTIFPRYDPLEPFPIEVYDPEWEWPWYLFLRTARRIITYDRGGQVADLMRMQAADWLARLGAPRRAQAIRELVQAGPMGGKSNYLRSWHERADALLFPREAGPMLDDLDEQP